MYAKDKAQRGERKTKRPDSPARIARTVASAGVVAGAAALCVIALLYFCGVDMPFLTAAINAVTGRNAAGALTVGAIAAGGKDSRADAPGVPPHELMGSGGAWDGAEIRMPVLSLSYDAGEETSFCVYREYLAECSRDSFCLFDKSGYEAFRKSVDFKKPAMYKRGDYLLVSDYGGRSAFVMKGLKTVWEETFTSGIVNASINKNGYLAFVLEAAGYRNRVRVFAPAGNALFDWVVADDYVLSSEVAPSGKEIMINRLKTDGISLCSGLELLDMKSEPFRTIDSGEEEVFLSAIYLEDNTVAAVTADTLFIYSESGASIAQVKFESVMSICEFPQKKAVVAVRRNNRAVLMEFGAGDPKGRAVALAEHPVRNVSADNGFLYINYGGEVAVLKENGKTACRLALDAETLYGGASGMLGVLCVNKKSADLYSF